MVGLRYRLFPRHPLAYRMYLPGETILTQRPRLSARTVERGEDFYRTDGDAYIHRGLVRDTPRNASRERCGLRWRGRT
jgi:hypothetical protein